GSVAPILWQLVRLSARGGALRPALLDEWFPGAQHAAALGSVHGRLSVLARAFRTVGRRALGWGLRLRDRRSRLRRLDDTRTVQLVAGCARVLLLAQI